MEAVGKYFSKPANAAILTDSYNRCGSWINQSRYGCRQERRSRYCPQRIFKQINRVSCPFILNMTLTFVVLWWPTVIKNVLWAIVSKTRSRRISRTQLPSSPDISDSTLSAPSSSSSRRDSIPTNWSIWTTRNSDLKSLQWVLSTLSLLSKSWLSS